MLVNEGFDSIASLAGDGWVMNNLSTPAGTTDWFQGDGSIFTAQAGAAESYIAANFNNAADGGVIRNWLITPEFSTASDVVVSFYAKADIFAPYLDLLAYGVSSNGSSDTSNFSMGTPVVLSGDWTQYTVNIAAQGAGTTARFAVRYSGAAELSNYIGVDTFTVSAVPEPASWLMLGAGMLGLAVRRRAGAAR
jgi:hypothetical protein